MNKKIIPLLLTTVLTGCMFLGTSNLSSSIIRTASDMLIINIKVDDKCTLNQLINSSQKLAALETLKAGYTGYIIRQVKADNFSLDTQHIEETQKSLPVFKITSSTKDKDKQDRYHTIIIQMFNSSNYKTNKAIDAKLTLGPKWNEILQKGQISRCE